MRYYLDASALVKTLVPEPGAEQMLGLAGSDCERIASRLSFVEVGSALWRLVREQRGTAADAGAAMPSLSAPEPRYVRPIELDSEIAARALA